MQNILRFISVYSIIIGTIFYFYFSITNQYKDRLEFTKHETHGVTYLKSIFNITLNVASGLEFYNNKLSDTILKDIEQIYSLQDEYPKFKYKPLNKHLELLKNSTNNEMYYYEFLDFVNHENYRIGDVSGLLFESDRKMYFLNALLTHYMAEYLVSLNISHNLAEEFLHKGKLSKEKKNLFVEQTKLIYLSSEEVSAIIGMLKPYDDTNTLRELMKNILSKIDELSNNTEYILHWELNKEELEKYLEISHYAIGLSYQLNEENINIIESSLTKRESELENKLATYKFLLIAIILLISIISLYFHRLFSENFEKEKEIKLMHSTLNDLVLFSKTDTDGKITYISNAFEKLSGYSREELIGENFNLISNSDMDKSIFKDLWETILNNKTWVGEIKNRYKDGSSYWLESTIKPEHNDKNELIGFISYSENITNKKDLEIEKIKTQNALDFKTKFFSNLSHEIRTPLNAIIGLSDLVKKENLSDKVKDFMNKILSASDILLGVINDVLDISKIESGKMTIEKVPLNVKKTAHNIENIVSFKAKEKGVDINVDFVNLANSNRLGDSLRISQVLTNLLNNAIKFTPKGSVTLRVEDIDNSFIKFDIIDTGIGLKEEQITTLFEEYTQADTSTSRKYGGTGLGLSICKNLVELMGGEIWVKSNFGEGSTFSFQIPLEVDLKKEIVNKDETQDIENIIDEVNSIENINILIAEDNKTNQMILEMLLDDTKINLDFAENGEVAVKKFKDSSYDLIFMDIQMPKMNGYEATKAIREINSEILIIGLSGNAAKEEVNKALVNGMNNYLTKPIKQEKLYTMLYKYLKSSS